MEKLDELLTSRKLAFKKIETEPPAGPGFPELYIANTGNGYLFLTFFRFPAGVATGITYSPYYSSEGE